MKCWKRLKINNTFSVPAIDKMKVGDKDKTDLGEYSGLRVSCAKTGVKSFKYRYRSPIDNSLKMITLGHYPALSLAEARVYPLKAMREFMRRIRIAYCH